jgi:hypothetical protein
MLEPRLGTKLQRLVATAAGFVGRHPRAALFLVSSTRPLR